MEFAEVVNPHFAFPVVGVVLCAVLVFAFGFKSPVQPPSFNFDESEDRKNKRQKKTKQRTPSNGHIVNVDQQVTGVTKQQASPKQTANKVTPEKPDMQKPKLKKLGTTPKANSKNVTPAVPKVEQPKEDDDVSGGWTVAVARKDKKRGKKDDSPIPSKPETTKKEEAVESLSLPAVESTTIKGATPPKSQRSKKEKKQKESPNTSAEKKDEPQPGEQSDKENTPEVELVPKKQMLTSDTKETLVTDESDKLLKSSPKKKKGKKGKAPLETEEKDAQPEVESVPVIAKTIEDSAAESSKATEPDRVPDVSKEAQSHIPVVTPDPKSAKSPKKKKKNKANEMTSSEVSSSSATEQATSSVPASPLDQGAVASKSLPESSKSSTKEPVSESTPSSSPVQSSPQEGAQSTDKVTFDELGEWQQAKTVKKKKKARRDN